MKDNGVNVPKKLESGNNTHQVYENYSHKRDFAFPLFRFGIKPHKQIFKAELVEKTKELIKKPCFAKAINFRDVFAVSKIFSYTGLISIGGVPVSPVNGDDAPERSIPEGCMEIEQKRKIRILW